jgi:exosortase/archaeosortase family protein
MQVPGAGATQGFVLQPGLNYYQSSWGSILQSKTIPKGVTLVATLWCPDCKTPPTLLFDSETHPSNIDFPIVVPESSLSAAIVALVVPGVAGLAVSYGKGEESSTAESEEGGLRKIQRYLIVVAAVGFLALPLVITFNSFLTTLASITGFDRLISAIVPYEAGAVADLLRGFGLPAGSGADSVWLSGGFVPVVAFIDWNCAGWQGFALFGLTSAAGLGEIGTKLGKSVVLLAGALGILAINILRIFVVVLLGYFVGYPAALLFHDYGGTVLTLVWLLAFWALVLRKSGRT